MSVSCWLSGHDWRFTGLSQGAFTFRYHYKVVCKNCHKRKKVSQEVARTAEGYSDEWVREAKKTLNRIGNFN